MSYQRQQPKGARELSATDLELVLRNPVPSIITFHKPGCPYCEAFYPVLDDLADIVRQDELNIQVGKVNMLGPNGHEYSAMFGIEGVPDIRILRPDILQDELELGEGIENISDVPSTKYMGNRSVDDILNYLQDHENINLYYNSPSSSSSSSMAHSRPIMNPGRGENMDVDLGQGLRLIEDINIEPEEEANDGVLPLNGKSAFYKVLRERDEAPPPFGSIAKRRERAAVKKIDEFPQNIQDMARAYSMLFNKGGRAIDLKPLESFLLDHGIPKRKQQMTLPYLLQDLHNHGLRRKFFLDQYPPNSNIENMNKRLSYARNKLADNMTYKSEIPRVQGPGIKLESINHPKKKSKSKSKSKRTVIGKETSEKKLSDYKKKRKALKKMANNFIISLSNHPPLISSSSSSSLKEPRKTKKSKSKKKDKDKHKHKHKSKSKKKDKHKHHKKTKK